MLATWTESYQPLGDLNLKFKGLDQTANYRRELNLETATNTATFESEGRVFTRQAFISAVDQLMVFDLACDKPGQLSLTISLSSLLPGSSAATADQELVFKGTAPAHVEPNYVRSAEPVSFAEGRTISFEIRLQVVTEGGQRKINANNELEIENADRVTLRLAGATSFAGFDKDPAASGKDPAVECEKRLSAAAAYSYDKLYRRHLDDYQPLFKRVELFLGTNEAVRLPTDKRLKRLQVGEEDPQLAGLYVQYAR
jgi:alpha-L-fucosidase 2